MDPSFNNEHFDAEWASGAPHGLWWAYEERYKFLYDHICVARSNQVVIDFGCGDGSFLRSLRIRGYEGRLIGVESSEEGRKATREQLEKFRGMPFEVLQDLSEVELVEPSFVVVVCLHVVEHLQNPGDYFRKLLGMSDVLLLEAPLEGGFLYRRKVSKLERANDGRNPWGHINFWTASSFFRFLRENGAIVMQHHEHPAFLYGNTNPFDFSAFSVKRTIKNLLWWIIPKSLYRIVYSTFLLVVVVGERN